MSDDKKIEVKVSSESGAWVFAMVLAVFLFIGDPDVHDYVLAILKSAAVP